MPPKNHSKPTPKHNRAQKKSTHQVSQSSILTSKTPLDSPCTQPVYFHREYTPPYGFLCQWYLSPFHDPGADIIYNCAEQRMMHHKALLTGDTASAKVILNELDPGEQKKLGRGVKNWDAKAWDAIKFETVVEGNWLKFTQAKEHGASLRKKLLETGDRELVEAAHKDRTWGIGYNAANAEANRENWGENMLGKALMIVRERWRE